jgi:glutamate racemase
VLGCTHYPLLQDRLDRLAPWPVTWIDPAPAIARRVTSLLTNQPVGADMGTGQAVFTGPVGNRNAVGALLAGFGLTGPTGLEAAAPVNGAV